MNLWYKVNLSAWAKVKEENIFALLLSYNLTDILIEDKGETLKTEQVWTRSECHVSWQEPGSLKIRLQDSDSTVIRYRFLFWQSVYLNENESAFLTNLCVWSLLGPTGMSDFFFNSDWRIYRKKAKVSPHKRSFVTVSPSAWLLAFKKRIRES